MDDTGTRASTARSASAQFCATGCGCVWWIVGLTAVAWWLGGGGWGLATLGVTLVVTLVTLAIAAAQTRLVRQVEETASEAPGAVPCPACSGDGWIDHDRYNQVTCPICNGSGWQDAPRQGPPRMRQK